MPLDVQMCASLGVYVRVYFLVVCEIKRGRGRSRVEGEYKEIVAVHFI